MLEVKREHLNLAQIAKKQNIPYGKLYHTYLVLGSLSEAVKVCRKGIKNGQYFRSYMYILHIPSRGFISFRNDDLSDIYLYQRRN